MQLEQNSRSAGSIGVTSFDNRTILGHRLRLILLACGLTLSACGVSVTTDPEILERLPEKVDFNFHVRPLLSDRCFACHGPDSKARKANLRLDTLEGAVLTPLESGDYAVVGGSLRRSRLWTKISAHDPEDRMPPPDSNLSLSEYEVALLGRWIEQRAEWRPHWAFIPARKTEPSQVEEDTWITNKVDRFVLARLRREGLQPSPEADRERILRRVSMDLTGLPPTPKEIEDFLQDTAPGAYERVVDRLLASPAYGERMALDWMDVARYADSHGYHADGYRMMWPWRDWIIEAYNRNMPYDRFIQWQLAGDLLPNASREQILATAFNRNHQMTAEGGIVDEEYRLEYVFDRTETTARAFLGLTMECARCHDHKFDPLSQKDYYQLAAFFNNVDEVGMTGDDGNAGPLLPLPTEEQGQRLKEYASQIARLERALEERSRSFKESPSTLTLHSVPSLADGLVAHYPLDSISADKTFNRSGSRLPAKVSGNPEIIPGAVGAALRFDNEYELVHLEKNGLFERIDPFGLSLWVRPESDEDYRVILGNAGNKNSYWRGFEVFLDSENRVSVRLIHALPHNYLWVTSERSMAANKWNHLAVSYDGSSRAAGLSIFLNGKRSEVEFHHDHLYKSIKPINAAFELEERGVRVSKSYRSFSGDNGTFTGAIDDIRLYGRSLSSLEVLLLIDGEKRSAGISTLRQDAKVRALLPEYLLLRQDPESLRLRKRLQRVRSDEHRLQMQIPEVMVMREMDQPRTTHVLNRGIYDSPLEPVEPGTPAQLGPYPEDLPRNRLGLARWLTSHDHPLTARVTVNRFWQIFFGTGLVRTAEDFGVQGSLPSHPELLDWLAVEFVESGWDVKRLMKLIAMSSTYRQSSAGSPELDEIDPQNNLLARGPKYRLMAEMIRNNALAASGLLVRRIGGPSVKPYQPPGLWIEKGTFSHILLTYEPDKGEGLYRRGLYSFIKRTSPPPSMVIFDATDRSRCVVRRQTTSTPLQALVLLNDPQYVEAGRMLGQRMIREGGGSSKEQLAYGFQLATGRKPVAAELEVLQEMLDKEVENFAQSPKKAKELLSVGDSPRDPQIELSLNAAMAVVGSVLLNHDEAYMKR